MELTVSLAKKIGFVFKNCSDPEVKQNWKPGTVLCYLPTKKSYGVGRTEEEALRNVLARFTEKLTVEDL